MAASQGVRGWGWVWLASALLCQLPAAAAVRAQGTRYANAYVDRPLVQPSMLWAFDGALSVTSLPLGKPLITAPNLGTRIGVPSVSIVPSGLEVGASVLPLSSSLTWHTLRLRASICWP